MLTVLSPLNTFSQITFSKSPTSKVFQAGTTNQNSLYSKQTVGATAQDIINQNNRQAMQMMGYQPPVIPSSNPQLALEQAKVLNQNKQLKVLAEINALISEDLPVINYDETPEYLAKTSIYRQAFSEIIKMHNGLQPFSLKKTIFILENAYLDNSLNFDAYNKQILLKTKLIKSLLKKEGIKASNNLGKNYIIQKLFSERIVEYKDTVVWRVHKPYKYDFNDFKGDKDWTNMFVTKLLNTRRGQCHSLPLLYLIFAEELKTKAWLSLAPEHSFIIFSDNAVKNLYFFETTNGNPVSDNFLLESGFITSQALKNRIYLDTLNKNGLIASCLADLIMGYTNKFGYDNFIDSMVETLLKIYPNSIQGQIFKADLLALQLNWSAKQKHLISVNQFSQYPEVNNFYTLLMQQYDYIDNMGYMQMPKDRYESWLLSLNDEKHQQDKKKLKTILIGNVKKDN